MLAAVLIGEARGQITYEGEPSVNQVMRDAADAGIEIVRE